MSEVRGVRTCLRCHHFIFNRGQPHYSHYTPGYGAAFSCDKNVWESSLDAISQDEFRAILETASTCKHFHHYKEKPCARTRRAK